MEKLNINNRRYLGSKNKLVGFIKDIVESNCGEYESFLDLFGGTGVVANTFNDGKTQVYINDILKSNYCSYNTWFGSEKIDTSKLDILIDEYNNIKLKDDNYFSINFGDMYFSKNDAKQIGFIRDDIEKKYKNKKINKRERDILVTSLLYSADRIANTVGHYDAYRKNTLLKDCFRMYKLDVENNENSKNKIYNMDSNKLVKEIQADIVYIDPPYNSRQYSDAYHLLENLAEWKKPKVYGVARKMDRSTIKSNYCTSKAVKSFKTLIEDINAKYILVSYNNMGTKGAGRSQAKISDKEILEILETKGKARVFETDYNYFTTGKTDIDEHKERVFLCEVGKKEKRYELCVAEESTVYGNVKSPINYTGGKYRLLNQLIPEFPMQINTFVDVFCGGFNVGSNVSCNKIIAIDNNKPLIRLLELFKAKRYFEIISQIEEIIKEYNLSNTYENGYTYYGCNSDSGLGNYNKDKFINLRKAYNECKSDTEQRDYLFLTLIIYCFNNQIRFNSKNEFNSPVGKRDFNNSIRNNIKNFCERIQNQEVEFIAKDFENMKEKLKDEMFFYFDPPYFLGQATYNENNGWNEEKEKKLLNFIKYIDSNGNKFALSNVIEHKGMKNNILIDFAIENNYNIRNLAYNYNNSSYHKKDRESLTKEVLITNY